MQTNPRLTIITVNYNSADFLCLSLKALHKLTKNPWKIFICDNGSTYNDFLKLRHLTSKLNNVFLFTREQTSFGSSGHGEALNLLSQFIDTQYGVIMDADCIPLLRNWDETLIDQLNRTNKIVGTPLAVNTPKGDKFNDFPLIFLCLFDTEVFKKLNIDFRPKDTSSQDTGWELREKYNNAGFKGKNLIGQNTRLYRGGPFADTICVEYYNDKSCKDLVCCHFGRGSNPRSGKYGKTFVKRLADRYFHRKDKRLWISICERIIQEQSIPMSQYRE